MRTTVALMLGVLLSAGVARTTLGQMPAGAKIQGVYATSAQPKKEQPYRVEMWVPEQMVGGGVQQAGHGHAVPGNPHMMGGGTFPYGSAYDHGHPGKMFDGGRYGYFGGAHRTPGYPHHHHMNREYVGPQGPPTAAVAYPYYTIRGPRDFLLDNPPSIGR